MLFGVEIGLDMGIVIGFLLLTLIIGVFFCKGVNSIKQYAIGDRNFSTGVLAATITATWIGGGFFSLTISKTYSDGINYIILGLCEVVAFLVLATLIAPRIKSFLGSLSVAESMGTLYGKNAQIITALVGIARVTGTIAIQFKVCSTVLTYFFGISSTYSTIVSASIIMFYTALGGIRAVTFTDVIQFITFTIFIPILSMTIWGTIDNPQIVLDTINTNPALNFTKLASLSGTELYSFIALIILFIIPGLDPAIFQRIIISKDITQAKHSLYIATGAFLFISLVTFWMGVLLLSNAPDLNPVDLLGYVVDEYTYTGLKGLLLAGILAMLMSTADSYIHSASILFSHDFCVPLNLQWAQKNELLLSRIFAVVISIFALMLALSTANLFEIILVMAGFYMPLVTVPLLLAIFGFRTSVKSYSFGIIVGFFSTLFPRIFDLGIDGAIIAVISIFLVALSILSFHYLLNQTGGWKLYQKEVLCTNNTCSHSCKKLLWKVQNFNIVEFCKMNTPKNEITYTLVGLFFIVAVFSTMYSISFDIRHQYPKLLEFIYHSVLTISSGFLTYPMWPPRFKNQNFGAIFWIMGLFYILVFVGCLQVIISNFGQFQLMVFLLGIVILSTLVRWQAALLLIITGCISSVYFFKWYAGIEQLNGGFGGLQFKIMYVLILLSSILIVFFKPKQEHLEQTEHRVGELSDEVGTLVAVVSSRDSQISTLDTKVSGLEERVDHYTERTTNQAQEIERLGATAQRILNNVNHELRLPVGNVMNFSEMLHDGLGKLSDEQLKMLSKEVYQNSNRLSTMILNMLDLATLQAKKIELQIKLANFSELVEERLTACRKIYVEEKPLKFIIKIEKNVMVPMDANYIRQTIDNLVINAINFSEKGKILVIVARQTNFVTFTIQDQGIGIPLSELYDVFTPFKMGSNTETKAEGRGVGLALCKAAVNAHGGEVKVESSGAGVLFRVVLPLESDRGRPRS
ncbi:MAG: hypothetical protein COA94_07055 [Rickettsiales bacterium]|nr:MAG: hypothetical protein COA94_07055 [Rickettsiales bacterium]